MDSSSSTNACPGGDGWRGGGWSGGGWSAGGGNGWSSGGGWSGNGWYGGSDDWSQSTSWEHTWDEPVETSQLALPPIGVDKKKKKRTDNTADDTADDEPDEPIEEEEAGWVNVATGEKSKEEKKRDKKERQKAAKVAAKSAAKEPEQPGDPIGEPAGKVPKLVGKDLEQPGDPIGEPAGKDLEQPSELPIPPPPPWSPEMESVGLVPPGSQLATHESTQVLKKRLEGYNALVASLRETVQEKQRQTQ